MHSASLRSRQPMDQGLKHLSEHGQIQGQWRKLSCHALVAHQLLTRLVGHTMMTRLAIGVPPSFSCPLLSSVHSSVIPWSVLPSPYAGFATLNMYWTHQNTGQHLQCCCAGAMAAYHVICQDAACEQTEARVAHISLRAFQSMTGKDSSRQWPRRTQAMLLAQPHDALEQELDALALVRPQPPAQDRIDLHCLPGHAGRRLPQHKRLPRRRSVILQTSLQ